MGPEPLRQGRQICRVWFAEHHVEHVFKSKTGKLADFRAADRRALGDRRGPTATKARTIGSGGGREQLVFHTAVGSPKGARRRAAKGRSQRAPKNPRGNEGRTQRRPGKKRAPSFLAIGGMRISAKLR